MLRISLAGLGSNDMPPAIVKNCLSKSGFSTADPDPSEYDSDAIITEVGQQLHCLYSIWVLQGI